MKMHASGNQEAGLRVSRRLELVPLHLGYSTERASDGLKNIGVVFSFLFLLLALWPSTALALPFFARQIGRDCTYCHTLIPKLNEKGRIFRSNGYRFPAEGEWKEVSEMRTIPASLEVEADGNYNRVRKTSWNGSSNIQDSLELTVGGATGRTGKVSALVAAAERNVSGAPSAVSVHKGFVQINDIIGPTGEGALNVRAGRFDVGFPFFNVIGEVITNGLLAGSVLNVLTSVNAAEINGLVVAEEDSRYPTHRYSIGATTEDGLGQDKLKGYYAAYSATFKEVFSVGGIYRGGQALAGGAATHFDKWGIAAEADAGTFILTIGCFGKEQRGTPALKNYVAEAILLPAAKVSFAGRYDVVKANGLKETKAGSLMARYNILSNVFTQLELRTLSDSDHIKGANAEEQMARLSLTALF